MKSTHKKDANPPVLPAPLRGIIPPMVTPLLGRDELDGAGLERLIEHILAGGVHGLFVLGTTGEAPSHTKMMFEPDTVRQALDIPGVVGLKDSSGNMVYFHRLQSFLGSRPDFTLLVGPEELLGETVLLGGHGGVNGGANLFPCLYVKLYEAALAGDRDTVGALHAIVMRISNTIYSTGHYGSSFMKGLKCALALEGICDDFMAEPFHRFREQERRQIQRYLEEIKPLLANMAS